MLFVSILSIPSPSPADEVHTNGTGGGSWSDPATWRGRKVPGPEDGAVIARGDVVIFDRNDEERITCNQLSIDPEGVLDFKTRGGKRVFCLSGVCESFGTIKLDGTKAAADHLELRLVGKTLAERAVKFQKGGVLLVSGRPNLPKNRRNTLITSLPADADKVDPQATIDAEAGTTLDIRRSEIVNVMVRGTTIDNTGAKPNERLNILENRFLGRAGVVLSGCDTPIIADNTFERTDNVFPPFMGIYILGCSLADVRGNTLKGKYQPAIQSWGSTDCSVTNCTIDGSDNGIYWYAANSMIKQTTVRNCSMGIMLNYFSGVIEDVTMENCALAFYHAYAQAQYTNCKFIKVPKDGRYISYGSGTMTLLNCNLQPDQIQFPDGYKPPVSTEKVRPPIAESMQYVILGMKGKVAPGSTVEVRTANSATPLAAGAADLNVRNSPARILASGMTPFPKSLEPLIVRTWIIDADVKVVPSPTYSVTVYGPPAPGAETPKAIKTTIVTPQLGWYREEPNGREPTVEVTLP